MAAGNPVFTQPGKYGAMDVVQEVINQALTTTQTITYDLDVSGAAFMQVHATLVGTVTPGDLSSFVATFRADGTTIQTGQVAPYLNLNPAAWGSDVYQYRVYDVRGLSKVRIVFQNLNAGTKTGIATVYLSGRS